MQALPSTVVLRNHQLTKEIKYEFDCDLPLLQASVIVLQRDVRSDGANECSQLVDGGNLVRLRKTSVKRGVGMIDVQTV